MSLLATPEFPTAQLQWDSSTRMFVAEASELPNLRVGRVYDDACDEGFTLIGRRGERVPLVLSNEEICEGDLLYTDFTPVRPADARVFAGVRIFND